MYGGTEGQNTTALQNRQQHFRQGKKLNISHFRKHNISENTMTFRKPDMSEGTK